jgi:radical SAM protein with 4Fe4S-binding SPASM domain
MDDWMPELHSFITYRAERVGGFLFNPYLQRELPLSEWELAVVELCDGRRTTDELAGLLGRAFRCGRPTAEIQVAAALERFASYAALRGREGSHPPRRSLPQEGGSAEGAQIHPHPCPPPQGGGGWLVAPLSILWEVTHACNLGCRHCLSACGQPHPAELTTAEALGLIDEMARLRVFTVTLGGGEPLVRPDLWALLERITEHGMCARLSTNGYAVTEDTVRRLEGLNLFAVQVSVDGLGETHDWLRRRPGSFERAIDALRLFGEAGCYTMMTVAASAANLAEVPALLALAAEIRVTAFKVAPHVPLGRARQNRQQLALTRAQIRWLAEEVAEQAGRLNGKMALQTEGLFPWLLEPEPDGGPAVVPIGPGCSAGTSQLVVSYDGRVIPCPYMRRMVVGQVRQTELGRIWREGRGLDALRRLDLGEIRGPCRTCGHLGRSCTGGCRGAALAAGGDLYAPDPYCWVEESS